MNCSCDIYHQFPTGYPEQYCNSCGMGQFGAVPDHVPNMRTHDKPFGLFSNPTKGIAWNEKIDCQCGCHASLKSRLPSGISYISANDHVVRYKEGVNTCSNLSMQNQIARIPTANDNKKLPSQKPNCCSIKKHQLAYSIPECRVPCNEKVDFQCSKAGMCGIATNDRVLDFKEGVNTASNHCIKNQIARIPTVNDNKKLQSQKPDCCSIKKYQLAYSIPECRVPCNEKVDFQCSKAGMCGIATNDHVLDFKEGVNTASNHCMQNQIASIIPTVKDNQMLSSQKPNCCFTIKSQPTYSVPELRCPSENDEIQREAEIAKHLADLKLEVNALEATRGQYKKRFNSEEEEARKRIFAAERQKELNQAMRKQYELEITQAADRRRILEVETSALLEAGRKRREMELAVLERTRIISVDAANETSKRRWELENNFKMCCAITTNTSEEFDTINACANSQYIPDTMSNISIDENSMPGCYTDVSQGVYDPQSNVVFPTISNHQCNRDLCGYCQEEFNYTNVFTWLTTTLPSVVELPKPNEYSCDKCLTDYSSFKHVETMAIRNATKSSLQELGPPKSKQYSSYKNIADYTSFTPVETVPSRKATKSSLLKVELPTPKEHICDKCLTDYSSFNPVETVPSRNATKSSLQELGPPKSKQYSSYKNIADYSSFTPVEKVASRKATKSSLQKVELPTPKEYSFDNTVATKWSLEKMANERDFKNEKSIASVNKSKRIYNSGKDINASVNAQKMEEAQELPMNPIVNKPQLNSLYSIYSRESNVPLYKSVVVTPRDKSAGTIPREKSVVSKSKESVYEEMLEEMRALVRELALRSGSNPPPGQFYGPEDELRDSPRKSLREKFSMKRKNYKRYNCSIQ